jgi:molybdate transport system permease protein
MRSTIRIAGLPPIASLFAAALVGLMVLPLVALALSSSVQDLRAAAADPMFAPALWLSLRTTLVSLALTLVMGTPLAWWLASSRSRAAGVVAVLVELPIVIPPAVVGVALLQTFGRRGLFGPALEGAGVVLPFTENAVVLAQLVVSAPFYVQAAANAFRSIDADTLIVARTLGASPGAAFRRVALPIALPGLIAGASLAWARALGEFGATLLFAGNMTGETQTMPLAIFSALESDVRLAVVFSLVLAGIGALLLVGLRVAPGWLRRHGGSR